MITVNGSGAETFDATAAVRLSFVDAEDAWHTTGDVTGTYKLENFQDPCEINLQGSGAIGATDASLSLELGDQGQRSYQDIAKHGGVGGSSVSSSGTSTCTEGNVPEPTTAPILFGWWFSSEELQPTSDDGGTLTGNSHAVDTVATGSTVHDSSWTLTWKQHPVGAP